MKAGRLLVVGWSEVERRNKMVGGGVAVRVEKRIIRSVVFGSWRDDGVRMRNSWVVGRCWWVGWGSCGGKGRARSWVWSSVSGCWWLVGGV